MATIVVAGSNNTDMVVKTSRLPAPGETILGGAFFMNAGGKGANQAVAAARLGGTVSFIAALGNDAFGASALHSFKEEGISTQFISVKENHPSGVALITVDEAAENCIVVAPGANAQLSTKDINAAASLIKEAAVLLLQLEVPVETVLHAAQTAAVSGVRVILNPAPASPLPDAIWQHITLITPNEKEAELLTGIAVTDEQSAAKAANALRKKGVQQVIITLGAKGAYLCAETENILIPAPVVKAVDTTAAGDVFNGALAVALSEGMALRRAVSFAIQAASISVTRMGAQTSAPHRHELGTLNTMA